MKVIQNIFKEPKGDVYRTLVTYSLRFCKYALLVVRGQVGLDTSAIDFLKKMEPFLIRSSKETEWPGTRLVGDTAVVYRYHLNDLSAHIIKNAVDSLYSWTQPNMPEDLCLLRVDFSPWLVSIAHERDAYLELTEKEREQTQQALSDLILIADGPAYQGFPLIEETRTEGFCFGTATDLGESDSQEARTFGRGFVEGPDGSRAGIMWELDDEPYVLECSPPDQDGWGIYNVGFIRPVKNIGDLVFNFQKILPQLKKIYSSLKHQA